MRRLARGGRFECGLGFGGGRRFLWIGMRHIESWSVSLDWRRLDVLLFGVGADVHDLRDEIKPERSAN